MILVVLALIWVVALTPTILRKLAEREGTYSVARFHRSLRAMRRAFPREVAAIGASSSGVALLTGQHAARQVAMPTVERQRSWAGAGELRERADVAERPRATVRTVGPSAKRRRQVLGGLAGGVVLTFLFGLVPGLGPLWYVSLLLLVLTAGYVALLIHFRRLADERAEKVVILEPPVSSLVTAQLPRVKPYRPGSVAPAPAFRTTGSMRLPAPQPVRPEPVVVGG